MRGLRAALVGLGLALMCFADVSRAQGPREDPESPLAELERAIAAWTELLERDPDGPEAEDALAKLARSHETIAEYEAAAQRYEQYARVYPEAERAEAALENAYLLRLGLGQLDAARADLGKWEAMYADAGELQENPVGAKLFWAARELHESDAKRRAHALAYLARYGPDQGLDGGLDRAIVAEVTVAAIDWRRSCRETLLHDSCISISREHRHPSLVALEAARERLASAKQDGPPAVDGSRFRPPERCNPTSEATLVTVYPRRAKLAAAAQARFKSALKMIGIGNRVDIPEHARRRAEDYKNAWAMALVYRADVMLEEFLALDVPAKLDLFPGPEPEQERYFGPGPAPKRQPKRDAAAWREYERARARAWDSRQRLGEYLETKSKLARELEDRYGYVEGTGSPHWVLAVAWRTALIYQSFADQLLTVRVPARLRDATELRFYCEEMFGHSAKEPAARALALWQYCVTRSTEYQYFNQFSRMCEAELAQRSPFAFPRALELFGEPGAPSTRIEAVSLLDDRERLLLEADSAAPE